MGENEMNSKQFDVKKKNRVKRVRVVLQAAFLLALVALIVWPLAFPGQYKPYAPAQGTALAANEKDGFVALGFFEIAEAGGGTSRAIPTDRMDEFLSALKDSGFQTVSQEDIVSYFTAGKPLPEKALFLMFEDGRKDTTTLAHKILEKLNYKASVFNFAQQLEKPDPLFLNANEIKTLINSSYWESGSNGYRVSYINTYDRYGNYLGELNNFEYLKVRSHLGREYDHYLMDYLRDAEGVPLETTAEMNQRIQNDYALMRDIYSGRLGKVPAAYALMHANSGKFGTHDRASEQNELGMADTFALNFNREGFAYNGSADHVFDLTRMQPQSYWFTNHLLMRIQAETGSSVNFVHGDAGRAERFLVLQGQPEFKGSLIALTSQAGGLGLLRLKQALPQELDLSVRLQGNIEGAQALRLNADELGNNYLQVSLENNKIFVRSVENGTATELFTLDLREIDHSAVISREEDERRGLVAYYNALMQYDEDPARRSEAQKQLAELEKTRPLTVAEGALPYIPQIDLRERGDRRLRVLLKGGSLEIILDGETIARDIKVPAAGGPYLLLESRPLAPEANQRHVYDPVYDGVFEDLHIKGTDAAGKAVVFDNNLNFIERAAKGASDIFNSIVDWFVHSL